MFSLKKDDPHPSPESEAQASGGQVSEGPNSFGSSETAVGGADAVPGTPDATPSTALAGGETPAAPGAS